jgi:adenylate kinase
MVVVVMGPPAAGKGTQCSLVADRLGLPHISTGVLLREAVTNGTPRGKLAQPFLDRGELVPDETMSALVEQRLKAEDAQSGAILDGFPRTVDQARKLDDVLARTGRRVDATIFLRVPVDIVLDRISNRFSCPQCGATYNIRSSPTRVPGRCDNCGEILEQRDDDRPEVAQRRLEVYEEQTAPLIDFYQARKALIEVDGAESIERVLESELAGLGQVANPRSTVSIEPKVLG